MPSGYQRIRREFSIRYRRDHDHAGLDAQIASDRDSPLEIGREFCSALRAVNKPSGRTSAINTRPAVAPKDHAFDATDNRSPLSYGRSLAVFVGVILPRCGKEPLANDHKQHPRAHQVPSRCPAVLLVYGEQRANAGIAGELELDGYQVHRASHAGTLRARCKPGEVDLVIFGRSPHRGLDMLRALRAGELAPGASGVRVLWMSASRETTTSVLRAFEAGADDVTRTPLGYAELLACARPSAAASSQPDRRSCGDRVRSARDRHSGTHRHLRRSTCRASPPGVRAARASCA